MAFLVLSSNKKLVLGDPSRPDRLDLHVKDHSSINCNVIVCSKCQGNRHSKKP
jgi:hypothetical protein